MARLHYDNIFGTASGNPITCGSGAGTASLAFAPGPGTLPAVTGSDYIVIILEPGTANEDIRYAQYSGSGTDLTVGTAQEGTTGISHTSVGWAHGPTAADFATGSFPSYTGTGSPQTVVTAGAEGESYVDTSDLGGIYFANNQNATAPDNWMAGIGVNDLSNPVPGIMGWYDSGELYVLVLADGISGFGSGVGLSDTAAMTGTFNGLFTAIESTDGTQEMMVRFGSSGQYTWTFGFNGALNLPGPLSPNYQIVTANYAMTGDEGIVQQNTSGDTVTLPDPSANGFLLYTIKNGSTGTVSLHTFGSEKIDNASGPLSLASHESVTVISDFVNWWVMSANAGAIV